MIDFDEIKLYLPKYLSTESEQNLFENLKNFPSDIDSRMYSSLLFEEDVIYQGDGIDDLLIINLPDTKIKNSKALILSNTCDIDVNNKRIYPSSICYSPIINLHKYIKKIESKKIASTERINQFIQSLKCQKISQILYLPKNDKLDYESFIFFDKINSCDSMSISRENLNEKRLFTLSNFGFYLFLFKLSIHFSRIREAVDRN
jgi:hypothetical protein